MKFSRRAGLARVPMVGIVVVVLAVAGVAAYYLSTPAGPSTSSSSSSTSVVSQTIVSPTTTTSAAAPYKIAVVASGPSTAYFAEFFFAGVKQAADALSTPQQPISVVAAYNVPSSQIISVSQSYASQGYKMLIFYVDYFANYYDVAKAVPGVLFVDEYATPNGYNSTTFNYKNPASNIYTYNQTNVVGWAVDLNGAYYVAGVAGALVTQTHKLAYDAAFNIPALAGWYNNYAAGVHSVNPSIPVYYGFTNDWTDPTKGAALADSLIARGSDVLATAGDTQTIGAAKEAIAKGTYGMGYPVNFNNFSARWMLGSVYFNATGEAMTIIHDALTNKIQGHYYDLDMAHNGIAFVLNPALVSSGVVTADILAKINAATQAVVGYSVTITQIPTFPAQPP